MRQTEKAKIFIYGRSQAVCIPAEFRFSTSEVCIRRDPKNGDLILSPGPGSLADIFSALDELGVPEDFLAPSDREQSFPQTRFEL